MLAMWPFFSFIYSANTFSLSNYYVPDYGPTIGNKQNNVPSLWNRHPREYDRNK